jgi:hypothetical protein
MGRPPEVSKSEDLPFSFINQSFRDKSLVEFLKTFPSILPVSFEV